MRSNWESWLRRAGACAALVGVGIASANCDAPDGPVVPECDAGSEMADGGDACVTVATTCDPNGPRSVAKDCDEQHRICVNVQGAGRCDRCAPGYREKAGVCAPVTTCAELACAKAFRGCVEAGESSDARCGACDDAHYELRGVCTQNNCDPVGAPGSMLGGCNEQHRECTAANGTAACTNCAPGYWDDGGRCVPVRRCGDLDCRQANRFCDETDGTHNAACTGCMAGFVASGASCVPTGAKSCDATVTAACTAANRVCVATSSAAACGACADGFIEDAATGVCRAKLACEQLDCAAQNRVCEEAPAGHCAACLPGFVADAVTHLCRPAILCNALHCGAAQTCQEASTSRDAYCREDCGGATGDAIWNGRRCEPCPPCDKPGEDGRESTPTIAGNCICRTKPSYFYSVAGDVGPVSCDKDGDGWVRESARIAIESEDPTLARNARCTLRKIDRFVLVNEKGQSLPTVLDQPLSLYESDRNDDDAILAATWSAAGLASYRPGSASITAAEVNRLTKLCHSLRADYNDNGVSDVEEWGGQPLGTRMRIDQAPFNRFSYFAELHTGRFEQAAGDLYGKYVIREKSRAAAPGGESEERVPLSYGPGAGDYWRSCTVRRDRAWNTQSPPVGMDFADSFDAAVPSGWDGMAHHSQFKCVVVSTESNAAKPAEQTVDAIRTSSQLVTQACRSPGVESAVGGNPAIPSIACQPVSWAALTPGDVVWGAVPYKGYSVMDDQGRATGSAGYERGCINECDVRLASCPGFGQTWAVAKCVDDRKNFGKFLQCEEQEICDGRYTDKDPREGIACDTGLPTLCKQGTKRCQNVSNAQMACVSNYAKKAEICNNLDDDCDGIPDNHEAAASITCDVFETVNGATRRKAGKCGQGTTTCDHGALGACVQVNQPTEDVCDGEDNDCDGVADQPIRSSGPESRPLGDCTGGRKLMAPDVDGDQFPSRSDWMCVCPNNPKPGYVTPPPDRKFSKWDCCDTDNRAFPGQGSAFTTPNACTDYDYDCNGTEDQQETRSGNTGCSWNIDGCGGPGWSWVSTVPECGGTAPYWDDCSGHGTFGSGCHNLSNPHTQACK
jgi:hypothetical protein